MLNEAGQTSRGPEFINPYGIQSMMQLSMPFESAVRDLGQGHSEQAIDVHREF
jgi:hypothetical protein